MGTIWPNAIIIDKDKTKEIALIKAMLEDASCWEDRESGRYQTKCQLLLCWFHGKKACVENLFPKLPKKQLNNSMCNMPEAMIEEDFNKVYRRFKTTDTNNAGALKYMEKGWARDGSLWKPM